MENNQKSQVEDTINDIKKSERFGIQIINHETGYRSEMFVTDWDGLRAALQESEQNGGPVAKDYILLVAVFREEETIIPQAPLISIETFMQMEH